MCKVEDQGCVVGTCSRQVRVVGMYVQILRTLFCLRTGPTRMVSGFKWNGEYQEGEYSEQRMPGMVNTQDLNGEYVGFE